MAAASRYPLVIQFKSMASEPKKAPMVGRAMFTDVPMKGAKKAAMEATSRAMIFILPSELVGFISPSTLIGFISPSTLIGFISPSMDIPLKISN